MEAGEYGMLGLDPMRRSGAHIGHERLAGFIADVDAGRVKADTDALVLPVESIVI